MLTKLHEFRRLRANRRLDPAEVSVLRLRRLRSVLQHAGKHVPFYQALWKEAEISSAELHELDDLERWPIITKQQLKQAGSQALAGGQASSDDVTIRTSGSTGDVLEVRLTRPEHRTRLLVEFRTLLAMGFQPWDRLAIVGPGHGRGAHWHERLGLFRTAILTMDLTVEEQIAALERFRPTILWAYPDCLVSLLEVLDNRLSRVIRPRIVITSAAVMPEYLRERLRADLGCSLFNFYGSMETGRLAAECPFHLGLHVNADQVIVECVQEDGLEEQGHGVVVVTALNAYRMPLIRYRLGDLSRAVTGACPCGCAFPKIEAPVGRADDALILPSGRILGGWQLVVTVREFQELDRFRFVQRTRHRLELEAVVAGDWSDDRQHELRRSLQRLIGEPMELEIKRVESIEAGKGKFRAFFSEVQ